MMISIVCPVFNKEKYLRYTLQSVLAQTHQEWELILVDDGSSDHSRMIAEKYAALDKRIRFYIRSDFEKELKGANICRNIGAKLSSGEHLIFLDADDILLPHCIQQRYEVLVKEPHFDLYIYNVAYTKGYDFPPYSKLQPIPRVARDISNSENLRLYFLSQFLSFQLPWHTTGPLWKKTFWAEIGGFDPYFSRLQDPEIHTTALLNKSVRINCQLLKSPYDALHLKDDNRRVWSSALLYYNQIKSVEQYVNKFVPLVKQKEGDGFSKHFLAYILFAEVLSYRYIRDDAQKTGEVRSSVQRIYQLDVMKDVIRGGVGILVKFYSFALKPTLIRRRIPGLILYTYKAILALYLRKYVY